MTTKNTVLSITVVFVVSFSILLWIYSSYPKPNIETTEDDEFYFKKFDEKKERVFLIGSSHVGRLNTTLVNEIVSEKNPQFEVYNLAIGGDAPDKRIKHMEKTIALNPKLIIYGISYRDFKDLRYSIDSKDNLLLPDPKKIITEIIFNDTEQSEFNPKLATLRVIRDYFMGQESFSDAEIRLPNNAFYTIDVKAHIPIKNDEQLRNEARIMRGTVDILVDESSESQHVIALKKIIEVCKENKISLVLYKTPLHPYYLDNISEKEKKDFNLLIYEISKKFDIPVYDLSSKYSHDSIWNELHHVAYNPKARIYSDDIAQIIINEIDK